VLIKLTFPLYKLPVLQITCFWHFLHVNELHHQFLRLFTADDGWMNDYVELVDWCWQGKTKYLGGKPVPVTLFLPKFTHGLAWDQALETMLRGQWLTASAMPWSISVLYIGKVVHNPWILCNVHYAFQQNIIILAPEVHRSIVHPC